jgi:chromosome segregation ATPase
MSNSHDELDSHMDDIKLSIKLLTELALRADERMDGLEEAQANSERKIAALADAQIRTEEAQASFERKIESLVEAQANSERKIAALADAQIRTEEAQQRTEESLARLSTGMEGLAVKMAELAAAQAHSDQRLDALIDIVRERLGGQPLG